VHRRASFVALTLLLLACGKTEPVEAKADPPAVPASPKKVIIVHAPADDVPTFVHGELVKAKAQNRKTLVYIGATWCEPCQRFHKAAEAGSLDAKFPDLTLVEFDLDRDGVRLGMAGYSPGYIPYFGVPNEDGRASGQGISGSIKGEGAVDDIVPRLEKLIGR
jgi:thiol-disulfide isomerase/thioredoxin